MIRTVIVLLLASFFASCAPANAAPVTVVDDSGARVTIARPPHRIVSVTPATTEMLFAVGLEGRIAGGTTSDDYPPAARKITRIGDWTPNYEKIVGVRPDLVVVDDVAEHAAAICLRSLHMPVLIIRPVTLSAVEADMRLIGKATGNFAQAGAAVRAMEVKLKAAALIAAADHTHPRVLPLIGMNPLYVAGGGTFIDDAIARAGGVNVTAALHGYAQYSPEGVISGRPDAILASAGDCRALAQTPAFRAVPAVRRKWFITIDSNLLQRPGPRLADGVLALAKALHGR